MSSLRSKAIEHILRTSAKDNDRNGFNLENFRNQSYSSFTLAPERFWYYFQGTSALAHRFFTGENDILKATCKTTPPAVEKSTGLCCGL